MADLNIYQDSYIGATIVSNRFIDEYMLDANNAQLKIYLYLLRMMNAHLKTGVPDICETFNYLETDVMRALRYWEKKGLLVLEYNEDNVLSGIHMQNLCMQASSLPPAEATHEPQEVPAAIAPAPKRKAASRASQTTQTAPAAPNAPAAPPKPSYSRDQVQQFRASKPGSQLLFLAETYLSRPLTAGDVDTLLYIRDELGFSQDLADYLLQYCAERGKRATRYIETVAIAWAEQGIKTPEQAKQHVTAYDTTVSSIMNGLGKSNAPTAPELEYISRWTGEYAFPLEIILEACKRTVLATDSNRIKYADRILTSWHEEKITSMEEIHAQDERHKASGGKTDAGRGTASARGNFHQFAQSGTDYESIASRKIKNED